MVYDVDEKVAALFNYKNFIWQDETSFYVLPVTVPVTTMNCIIRYLEDRIEAIYALVRISAYNYHHSMDNYDGLTLFNIIKAAYYLKVTSLMGLTCESFLKKVKIKMAEHIDLQAAKDLCSLEGVSDGGSRGRNLYWNTDRIRRANLKCRFTQKLEIGDVHVPSLVVLEFSLLDRRVDSFKADAHRFMVASHINEKEKYIRLLEKSVYADPCLADVLDTEVTEFLIQILKNHVEFSIKSGAISIISRATSKSLCQKIIEDEAVPELVNLISSEQKPLAVEAVNGLIRLARSSENYLCSILKHSTIQAVQGIVNTPQPRFFIEKLAMLLTTICYDFPGHCVVEKELALTLAKDLLRWEYDSLDLTTVHTLNAISYLSYRRLIPIEKEICSLFVMFIANVRTSPLVAGSALEIIGNVAAFGDSDQIENGDFSRL